MNFQDKVSVVTGATSGLGRQIAIELAKRNSNLLVIGRNAQKLEDLTGELKKLGTGKIVSQSIDFSDKASIEDNCQRASLSFPSFNYVFCCAGIKYAGLCRDVNLLKLDEMISVNYMSVVVLVKVLISKIARGGHIFIISSGAANFGIINDGGYCSSKAALERYSEALHSELSSEGIHVTSVSPGPMETGLFRNTQGYNGRKLKNSKGQASDPQTRAVQIVNHIGKDKRRLNLTLNTPIIRALSTFAPFILDLLVHIQNKGSVEFEQAE